MADHNITVSNTLDFFGPSRATIWNTFLWNAENWGQVADLVVYVTNATGSTVSPTSDVVKYVTTLIADEGLTLDSSVLNTLYRTLANSLSLDADMSAEFLQDAAGYFYVFPDRTTDGESRVQTDYTSGVVTTTSWTSNAAASTNWS